MDGPEVSPESYENNIKTKESEIYRLRVGEQISRVNQAGSKDVVNDKTAKHEYENSILQLDVIMSPITGYKPWITSPEDKDLTYPQIIEKLRNMKLTERELWDYRAIALMQQIPKLGFMPPKSIQDEDLGESEDFRAWIKHRIRKNKKK